MGVGAPPKTSLAYCCCFGTVDIEDGRMTDESSCLCCENSKYMPVTSTSVYEQKSCFCIRNLMIPGWGPCLYMCDDNYDTIRQHMVHAGGDAGKISPVQIFKNEYCCGAETMTATAVDGVYDFEHSGVCGANGARISIPAAIAGGGWQKRYPAPSYGPFCWCCCDEVITIWGGGSWFYGFAAKDEFETFKATSNFFQKA